MRKTRPLGLLQLLLLLLPVVAVTKTASVAATPALELECLNVPTSVFASTVLSTLTEISNALSVVSGFESFIGDFRLSNAINDCLDLLDMSNDLISQTLTASHTGKTTGTGQAAADLRTWLSAALINQDTCIDGFEGTGSFIQGLVAEGVNQVSSLVRQVLYMVDDDQHEPPPAASLPHTVGGHTGRSKVHRSRGRKPGGRRLLMAVDGGVQGSSEVEHSFPYWVSPRDRKLLQATAVLPEPDAVVALDGSGGFTSIMDAVNAAPDHSKRRFVIYIKGGVYEEYVDIKRKKTNIMVYGDGVDATIITGDHSNAARWTTYRSATFAVSGAGFIARDLTIQNTAGPQSHQAVAFRSDSDLSAVYRCAFMGYQDTLYTHTNRQFYRECTITGTVDFVFGDAVAVFQNCLMYARKGLPNQKNTVTAQGRKDPGENTGFSIQFCNISGQPDAGPTYLGRPWKAYSRTVIMESYIGDLVRPEGWLEWNGDQFLGTLFYAEYMNHGPAAGVESRVKWPGYRVFSDSVEAENFTVAQFIAGNLWLPKTGVRYNAGLTTV